MRSFLLSTILCLLTFAATGQDGFKSIFNGKNLKGWTVSKENPKSFVVEDGLLMAKGPRAHLFYSGKVGKADFKNFELKMKVRTTPGSNSGVFIMTAYQEEGWPSQGFEAQVNSTHTDPRKTGSLYGIVNIWAPKKDQDEFVVRVTDKNEVFIMQPKAPSTDNEWFDYHILAQDNKVTIKVDGQTVMEWTQPENWDKGRKIGNGTVAIQAHDPKSEVHYKDIMIKVLD